MTNSNFNLRILVVLSVFLFTGALSAQSSKLETRLLVQALVQQKMSSDDADNLQKDVSV